MKKLIAFLAALCMALAMIPAVAEEETAGDCSGIWYFTYADVTIGELALNADGSYRMALYSQDAEIQGSWILENENVILTPQEGEQTAYAYDGTQLIPAGFDINFAIRREPGRMTDVQLNDYVQSQTIPEGMTEEELQEIIRGIYDAAEQEAQAENVFGEFSGIWVNDAGGYLTVWGKNITAAFPIDGEIQTGYYGEPGQWSREGNTLINSDGTIMVMRNDGSLLCSESSGSYPFTRVFDKSEATANPDAGEFSGDWTGTGILVTDSSGVKVYTPITGYALKIDPDRVYTLFIDEVNEYPYELVPAGGALRYTDVNNDPQEYVLYRDGTLRWMLSDEVTVFFRSADPAEATALYFVSGPAYVPAGSSAEYTVSELIGRRTYTWSAEGEGITIDPDTGILTAAEGTTTGTAFTVTATPDSGEEPAMMEGFVCNSMFDSEPQFEAVTVPYSRGFAIPAIGSWGARQQTEDRANSTVSFHYEADTFTCEESCTFIAMDFFPDADLSYRQIGENLKSESSYQNLEEKVADINGEPVYMVCFATPGTGESVQTAGFIYSIRENTILVMTFECNDSDENPSRVTICDLETIAGQIAFDPAKAPLRKEDGELSISSRGNPESVPAGKNVAFTAAFANAAAVRREKADALAWSVTDSETGNSPEGISIDEKGVLSVSKELTAAAHLEVTVTSEMFGTKATYPIIAVPVIRKLTAEPAEVVLYTGSDDSATIRVITEPEIVPEGLVWTLRPDTLAEVAEGENGTVTLIPLATGKGSLSVKEPGGKTAMVRISVLQPVETVELTASGKAVPGGVVNIAANIKPKNAGNRTTEWSLDVGEDIATINNRGKVRINRNAPEGTVITVTCTAVGAKVPVVETIEIVIGGN